VSRRHFSASEFVGWVSSLLATPQGLQPWLYSGGVCNDGFYLCFNPFATHPVAATGR